MPHIETDKRKQKAVYYAAGTEYTDTGVLKVVAGAELSVRWEERQSEALDGEGQAIRLDATVVVSQDIAIGSLMWLGALKTLPTTVTDLFKVITFNSTPNIKNTRTRRTVGLQRYSDKLPPIES